MVKVSLSKGEVWGITPRNQEQLMVLSLLLDDDIQIITLSGPSGSGKTLLSLACGLVKVVEEKAYETMYITRPFPPSLDKSLESSRWIAPVMDNLTLLFSKYRGSFGDVDMNDLLKDGVIEMEALIYTRGRSIPRKFIIVDDAQNLTPNQVKGILVQMGSGTKIILAGNPMGVDNPYLEPASNGLVYAIERLKTHELSGHMTLTKGERSDLAESIDASW
jgi:PhoH-like ATPase